MRVEKQESNKVTYVDFLNGHRVRVTTANGPARAKRIFDFIRAQNGIGRSAAMAQDLKTTRNLG
jgi:hypothetical protein